MHIHKPQFGSVGRAMTRGGMVNYGGTEALDAHVYLNSGRNGARGGETWMECEAELDRLTVLATGGLPSS